MVVFGCLNEYRPNISVPGLNLEGGLLLLMPLPLGETIRPPPPLPQGPTHKNSAHVHIQLELLTTVFSSNSVFIKQKQLHHLKPLWNMTLHF